MRNQRFILILACFLMVVLFSLYAPSWNSVQTQTTPSAKRDIHLFTIEHQSQLHNQKHEVYRFDPGSITVHQGEQIRLHIHGFHGKVHKFSIPKLNLRGQIKKGEVTTINFTANKLGTYEVICHNHATMQTNGPMIAYLTVVK